MIIFDIKFMLITYITKKDIFKTINQKKKKKKFNQSMISKIWKTIKGNLSTLILHMRKNKYITVYIYSSSLFDADFDNGPL